MGKKGKNKKKSNLPNVSICTPTFNRRPFFYGLIKCIEAQDYPHEKIEWIIVDDGTDSIKDIIESEDTKKRLKNIQIRYFYESEKMDLGKKRNYMHQKCQFKNDNDIIVYMDDDDYYPPERVSHSVKKLMSNPKVLCGGSSEIYLWFNTLDKMYKFGPYGPNHATAGTFSFKHKLLKQTCYQDDAVLAEEKHFLKDYSIPFIQFDPFKTILVVSHEQNTFDKKKLVNENNKMCNESQIKVKQFIKSSELEDFYKFKINNLLKDYEPGDVKNKPKVLEEIARRDKEREKMSQDMINNRPSGIIVSTNGSNEPKELTIKEVKEYMQHKTQENQFLHKKLNEFVNELNKLKSENEELKKENEQLKNNKIVEVILLFFFVQLKKYHYLFYF